MVLGVVVSLCNHSTGETKTAGFLGFGASLAESVNLRLVRLPLSESKVEKGI